MKKTLRIPIIGLGIFIITMWVACNSEKTPSETGRENLNKARSEYIAALNSNRIDAIMQNLSPDHVTMAPNEPAYDDREKLQQWHEYRIEHFDTEYQFKVINTKYSDSHAIDYWILETNSVSITDSESIMGDYKGLWIWEHNGDGQWELLWSIWNENIPYRRTEDHDKGNQ